MHDERRLQKALARRERAAWSAIYDRHFQEVFGLVYHLLSGDRAVAEDVHQEVWLAALEGFDQFDPNRGRFRDWLLGIARHRVSRHLRELARRPLAAVVDRAAQPHDHALSPPDQILALERDDVVRAALLELNPDYRDVLVQKYIDGRSVVEIAGLAGRSAKGVESLLSRARDRLRELLRPYPFHERPGDRHEPAQVEQPRE